MGWLHVLNSTSKEPTRNHFSTWEHSLGADAIPAALLDKHDVMTSFTRIKQIYIKSDTVIFGDIRVYWAVVIISTPLIGLEQVCYLSALLLLSIEW